MPTCCTPLPATNTRMCAQWILTEEAVSTACPGKIVFLETMKENASPPDDLCWWNLSLLSVESLHSLATVPVALYIYICVRDLGIRIATCEFHAFLFSCFSGRFVFDCTIPTRSIQSTPIFISRFRFRRCN